MEKTATIIRVWRDSGEAIAFFPEIPGNSSPYTCSSYMRIGQHGAAQAFPIEGTRTPRPSDFTAVYILMRELRRIGYSPRIVKRFTQSHLAKRRAELNRN